MFYTSGLRVIALTGLVAGAVFVAGCGGSKSTTTVNYTLTSAQGEIGQADFSGGTVNRGAAAGANTLSQPIGSVASDTTSGPYFYVADYNNSRILGFNTAPQTGTSPTANFVIGQADFASTQPNAGGKFPSATSLALPRKVSVGNGALVVTDSGNNRVLIWNTLPAGNVAPDVVIGQPNFTTSTSNSSGISASTLSNPTAATIAGNKLIVVDQGNDRVLIWNTIPIERSGRRHCSGSGYRSGHCLHDEYFGRQPAHAVDVLSAI